MISKKNVFILFLLSVGIFIVLLLSYKILITYKVEIDFEPYSNIDSKLISDLHAINEEFKVSPEIVQLQNNYNSIEFFFFRMENPTDTDLFDYRYGDSKKDILKITTEPINNEYCRLKTTFAPLFIPAKAFDVFHGRVYHQNLECNPGDQVKLNFRYFIEEINLTLTDSIIVEIVE